MKGKWVDSYIAGSFCIAVGAFTLGGAIYQWEFFMTNRRAQRLIGVIGIRGARIFYVGFGVLLLCLGLTIVAIQAYHDLSHD
jgi:hypothetical protein